MHCFVSTESNLKKQDPETSSGRQQRWFRMTAGVVQDDSGGGSGRQNDPAKRDRLKK